MQDKDTTASHSQLTEERALQLADSIGEFSDSQARRDLFTLFTGLLRLEDENERYVRMTSVRRRIYTYHPDFEKALDEAE